VAETGALKVKAVLGFIFLCVVASITAYSGEPHEGSGGREPISSNNPMTVDQNSTKEEAAIREMVDGFVKAIRSKDMTKVMSVFAEDVVSFDIAPPLQHGGGETFMKRWQELFDSYQGAIDYEVRDLRISASNDVAFSHSLNGVSGTLQSGQKSDRWLRWTACYRKTNGKWLIVHEQVSVPVDVRSGKAMLNLTP
jgi:uncharacterized protein (TIGR02246 family)